MKQLYKVPQGTNNAVLLYAAASTFFSEQEILAFQSFFFSPGFHCIKVPTVETGRSLLKDYTASCSHRVDSAFLSTMPVPSDYYNLYEELCLNGALSDEEGKLEEFVLSSLTHEFLIIEATPELLKTPWFGKFEQLLIDYTIMKEMTIIMFMY